LLRRRVQQQYGIKESEDASTCAVALCGSCSIMQDISELESRGHLSLFGEQPTGTTMKV